MSNPVQRGPGNDAYGGGALIRAAPPTSGPTGALPGPNTSTPLGGVNPPSTPFFARPNSGTNILIPYNRVVPLSDPRGGGLPKIAKPDGDQTSSPEEWYTNLHADTQTKTLMSETDTLHATRIAFVLAKKSHLSSTQLAASTLTDRDFVYAINSAIAPALPGTQRLQKLCSLEYAMRYVDHVANRPGHFVNLTVNDPADANAPLGNDKISNWTTKANGGLLHDVYVEAMRRVRLRQVARPSFEANIKLVVDSGGAVAYQGPDVDNHNYSVDDENFTVDQARAADGTLANKVFAFVREDLARDNAQNPDTMNGVYASMESMSHLYDDSLAYSGLPPANASLCNIGDIGRLNGAFGSAVNVNPSIPCVPMPPDGDGDVGARPNGGPGNPADNAGANVRRQALYAKATSMGSNYPILKQGIFTMDEGPFLRGFGMAAASDAVKAGYVAPREMAKYVSSYFEARCRGDELAFAVLEHEIQEWGCFDWTPDGLCLSKFDNTPLDKLEDQRIDARDGALYNIGIQGPALTTTWTGDPSMEVLPMDKVFVILVADVFMGQSAALAAAGAARARLLPPVRPSSSASRALYRRFVENAPGGELLAMQNVYALKQPPPNPAAMVSDLLDAATDKLDIKPADFVPTPAAEPARGDFRTKLVNAFDDFITTFGRQNAPLVNPALAIDGAATLGQQLDKMRNGYPQPGFVPQPPPPPAQGAPPPAPQVAPTVYPTIDEIKDIISQEYEVVINTTKGTVDPADPRARGEPQTRLKNVVRKMETDGLLTNGSARTAAYDAAVLALRNELLRADYATDQSRWKTLVTTAGNNATFAAVALATNYSPDAFRVFDATPALANLNDGETRGVLASTGMAAAEIDASMGLLEKYVAYLNDQPVGGEPVSRQDFEKARALLGRLTEVEKFDDDDGDAADGLDAFLALGPADDLVRGYKSYEAWKAESEREFSDGPRGPRRLGHFRLKLATSSQMINYSPLAFDKSTGRQQKGSRMGLKLGTRFSEYIVGGWCIGTVTDAAASRASMPNGMPMGPRSAPNTAAINLHVNIEWWNADRMHRSYCNYKGDKKGIIRARFEAPEQTTVMVGANPVDREVLSPLNAVDKPRPAIRRNVP